jgi:hypothetical protein
MANPKFERIIDALHRGRQRATYGAVAALIGRPTYFLMAGCPRDHRHSWIVNKQSGLPTGYHPEDMHPEILSHPEVLSTTLRLESWLRRADS